MKDKQDMILAIARYKGDPFDHRKIETFCADMEMAKSTFYAYYNDNRDRIDYEAAKYTRKIYDQLAQESLKNLVQAMSKGNVKAIQLALEISGVYTPRSETTNTVIDETKKKARIEALLEKFKAKQGNSDVTPASDSSLNDSHE